jgi:hypothetical protein
VYTTAPPSSVTASLGPRTGCLVDPVSNDWLMREGFSTCDIDVDWNVDAASFADGEWELRTHTVLNGFRVVQKLTTASGTTVVPMVPLLNEMNMTGAEGQIFVLFFTPYNYSSAPLQGSSRAIFLRPRRDSELAFYPELPNVAPEANLCGVSTQGQNLGPQFQTYPAEGPLARGYWTPGDDRSSVVAAPRTRFEFEHRLIAGNNWIRVTWHTFDGQSRPIWLQSEWTRMSQVWSGVAHLRLRRYHFVPSVGMRGHGIAVADVEVQRKSDRALYVSRLRWLKTDAGVDTADSYYGTSQFIEGFPPQCWVIQGSDTPSNRSVNAGYSGVWNFWTGSVDQFL